MTNTLTPEKEAELRHRLANSTQVIAWRAHPGGDCYGVEATVRGPFFRWFRIGEVAPEYRKNVADPYADALYCALAMNSIPELLYEIDLLREQLKSMTERATINAEGALKATQALHDKLFPNISHVSPTDVEFLRRCTKKE